MKTIKDGLYEIIEKYQGEETDFLERNDDSGNNFDLVGEVKDYFNFIGVEHKVSFDEMYDSPGCDIYSLSVAWIEEGELFLDVTQISLY